MTIEIKNATYTQKIMDLASKNQQKLAEASIQAATLVKYQDFQGYASEGNVEKLLSFNSTLEITNSYIRSNDVVSARISTMEQSISKISDIAAEAAQLIASRQNGATGTEVPLDVLGEAFLNNIAEQLNVKFDNTYLFAGSKTNTTPVVNIQTSNLDSQKNSTSSYYAGNSEQVSIKISDSQELTYGVTANEEAFQQLIGAIHLAIEGHEEDSSSKIQDAMEMINDAVDKIGTLIATIGSSNQIVQTTTLTHNSVITLVTENLTDIVGGTALITDASVRIAEFEATIQATYMAFSRLNGLRLTNFL